MKFLTQILKINKFLTKLSNEKVRNWKLSRKTLIVMGLCTFENSMKILQFSRPPTLLAQLRPKIFHSRDLGRLISKELSFLSPNYNQSIIRKHNPRMTIISYQVFPSDRFRFQYQLINLARLSIDFFLFS